jgi:hypothetical protein
VKPTFFAEPDDFRAWLEENHDGASELWVGFHKKATGKPSITWPEAVDEALCFGWIDGIRRSLGDESYTIRFTPRKPRSTWSAVNIARAKELVAEGRMRPAGLAAFEALGRPLGGTLARVLTRARCIRCKKRSTASSVVVIQLPRKCCQHHERQGDRARICRYLG